jgi:hypothetical protein
MEGNLLSAVPVPSHPYLFVRKDPETGEVSFPFREDVGKGVRRQDFESVFLFVEEFAMIRDLESRFRPFLYHFLSDEYPPGRYESGLGEAAAS